MVNRYLVEIDGATFHQCFKDYTFDIENDLIIVPTPTINIRNVKPIDVAHVLNNDMCGALERLSLDEPLSNRSRANCFEIGYEEGFKRAMELLRYEK